MGASDEVYSCDSRGLFKGLGGGIGGGLDGNETLLLALAIGLAFEGLIGLDAALERKGRREPRPLGLDGIGAPLTVVGGLLAGFRPGYWPRKEGRLKGRLKPERRVPKRALPLEFEGEKGGLWELGNPGRKKGREGFDRPLKEEKGRLNGRPGEGDGTLVLWLGLMGRVWPNI